jgi:hypothetical protein
MRVSEKVTFNTYWESRRHIDKRPIRNGSKRAMVGDNIYYFGSKNEGWHQADSHHSNRDGSVNAHNRDSDTKTNAVLISDHFFYFGQCAPVVPPLLLSAIGYKNRRDHRRFTLDQCASLVDWFESEYQETKNLVMGDPFNFELSHGRYDGKTNKVS